MKKQSNRFRFSGSRGVVAGILIGMVFLMPGCHGAEKKIGANPVKKAESGERAQQQTVQLYFADAEATALVAEPRRLQASEAELPKAIVEALVQGPKRPGSFPTIPPGTKVNRVSVAGGTAAVDFSNAIRTAGWGGSAGEGLLVYSVVQSLTQLPGIERVQFLIDGKTVETLWGHMDTTQPFLPRPDQVRE